MSKSQTILVTGGAGYVGTMLAEQFSARHDVDEVICLDKEPLPELLKGNKKIFWITGNTSDEAWQEAVRAKNPAIQISMHTEEWSKIEHKFLGYSFLELTSGRWAGDRH